MNPSSQQMDDKRLVKDELVGLPVTILECTDPSWVGRNGVIVDETKNTLLIDINQTKKRIAKSTATFAITYHGTKTIVAGTRLAYRPEDRTKKAR